MGGPEFPYKYLLWHDIFRRANTINITTPHISGTVRDISTEFGLKVYDVILHHSFCTFLLPVKFNMAAPAISYFGCVVRVTVGKKVNQSTANLIANWLRGRSDLDPG